MAKEYEVSREVIGRVGRGEVYREVAVDQELVRKASEALKAQTLISGNRLTDDQVVEVITRIEASEATKVVAALYGISTDLVITILSRKKRAKAVVGDDLLARAQEVLRSRRGHGKGGGRKKKVVEAVDVVDEALGKSVMVTDTVVTETVVDEDVIKGHHHDDHGHADNDDDHHDDDGGTVTVTKSTTARSSRRLARTGPRPSARSRIPTTTSVTSASRSAARPRCAGCSAR